MNFNVFIGFIRIFYDFIDFSLLVNPNKIGLLIEY